MFDEIQMVRDFERVLNSLRVDYNVSIFVTGLNANLLSGRYVNTLPLNQDLKWGRYETLR